MILKHFMPLLLFLSLATESSAHSDSRLDGGWQVAQVPVPTRRSTFPAFPSKAANTNSPAIATPPATGPAVPNIPALPNTPPAAGAKPGMAVDLTGKTNDVADITYNFLGVPLDQLLDIYADLVGRTLLRSSGGGPGAVPKDATIALKTQSPLTHAEAIIALETILGMNGITIVPIGDKFAKVVAEAQAGAEGGLISTNTNNMPEAGKMVTQIVQVKFTDLKDLSDVLQPFSRMPKSIIALPSTQTLILRDYAENVDRMVEMIKRIDVLTPLAIKPRVIAIKYALASDIASALSALGASGGTAVGKSSSGAGFSLGNRSGASGGSFTGAGSMGGGMGGIGGAGGYGGQGGSVFGQATGASALGSAATGGRSSFQQNLGRIVQNAANGGQFQLFGQTKIIADERTNSLLVFANDEDMKMIEDIISKLDVVLPQVLIDAIIMEINLQDTQNTGVSYLSQRQGGSTFTGAGGINNLSSAASSFLTGGGTSSNGTSTASGSTLASLPGGFSYFAKFGNDLNVVMEAVAGDSRVNVLSRPRIQTSHAVPADLFIGNTVPYVTGTYNYGYSSGPSSQYTQLEVGIHLQVLPLINKDGLVVMDIQADVEQLGPDVQIAGVGGVPTTTKRQAGAKVAVRDGETIVLGGFISDSRSLSDSGIPLLMNVPWLGNLFKSKAIENLRTELIMLMRPTVLPTPELAAIVATKERNLLSGVKQAELEIRHEEEDRNAAIEAELVKDAAKRAEKAKKVAREKAKNAPPISTTNAPTTIDAIPPLEGP
jgi:general secretion pathway protein D